MSTTQPGADVPGLEPQAAVPSRRAGRSLGGADRAGPTRRTPRFPQRRRRASRRLIRADAISWLHGGAQRLLDAVELSGVETPVWTFLGDPSGELVDPAAAARDVGASGRRGHRGRSRLRTRARRGGGRDHRIPRADRRSRPGAGEPRCRWMTAIPCICTRPIPGWVKPANGRSASPETGIAWSHEHGKGSVALRGGATELLLAMSRRTPSPTPASRCSAMTPCGNAGWSAHLSNNSGKRRLQATR